MENQTARKPPRNKITSDYCRVEGCDRPRRRIGKTSRSSLCAAHQARKDATGDLREDVAIGALGRVEGDYCGVEGCDRLRQEVSNSRRSLCAGHQARKHKYGDVFEQIPLAKPGERRVPLPVLAEQMKSSADTKAQGLEPAATSEPGAPS